MGGSVIDVEYQGRVAVLTINNERKLNALDGLQYYELAEKLREVARRDDVFITLLIGKGRFFSAGFDVIAANTINSGGSEDSSGPASEADSARARRLELLRSFVAFNLNITHAFATHPKVLVAALNGPVVGLSASLVALADFVYAAPHTFLLTPFASLGLVAEGGASRALVQRLGVGRANEALLMSRRIPAEELRAAGFVNAVFPAEGFRERVLQELDDRLGDHLSGGSLLGIKALLRRPERDVLDVQNVTEVFAGVDRLLTGIPEEQFRKLAAKEKRHKL